MDEPSKASVPVSHNDEVQNDEKPSKLSAIRRGGNQQQQQQPQQQSTEAEPRLHNSYKISVLFLASCVAFFIYLGLTLYTWEAILVKPHSAEIFRLRSLLKEVRRTLPPMSSFNKFRHYLLNHGAVEGEFCINLTSVVCETFLSTMPANMSYQDFLADPDQWVTDFPHNDKTVLSPWEWRPMIDPFEKVTFAYNFTEYDLAGIVSCVQAVRAARTNKRTTKVAEYGNSDRLLISVESIKYFAAGACRLDELVTFERRASILWQLCLAGCGGSYPADDASTGVDWSVICDTFLFMTPEVRAVHNCHYFPEITTQCQAIQTRASYWCGLNVLLEEVDG